MGLFSSKKNNNQQVVQDETYFELVAEIEGGIPVGNLDNLYQDSNKSDENDFYVDSIPSELAGGLNVNTAENKKSDGIIFDDDSSMEENKPVFNTENLHNPIEDFMPKQPVMPPVMEQPMMQQMPVQQPMAPQMPMQQMPYNPNYCFIKTEAPLEDTKVEEQVVSNDSNEHEEYRDRPSKFFTGEEIKEEEPYYKRKEKVAPITGTTSIFNIGMIKSQNNDGDKRI